MEIKESICVFCWNELPAIAHLGASSLCWFCIRNCVLVQVYYVCSNCSHIILQDVHFWHYVPRVQRIRTAAALMFGENIFYEAVQYKLPYTLTFPIHFTMVVNNLKSFLNNKLN